MNESCMAKLQDYETDANTSTRIDQEGEGEVRLMRTIDEVGQASEGNLTVSLLRRGCVSSWGTDRIV